MAITARLPAPSRTGRRRPVPGLLCVTRLRPRESSSPYADLIARTLHSDPGGTVSTPDMRPSPPTCGSPGQSAALREEQRRRWSSFPGRYLTRP